ncbi:MAG TPA: MMPL family transporter, partial [Thermoanaerobaculia bacterium]|nr:MMPL family transporter [Thermoanaerobaculia bacterium]
MLSLARAALRRPRLVLALFAAATAVMAAGLGRLQLRTDGAAIYPRGNPTVVRTLQDQETFQELPQVIVLLTARPGGPAVASPAGFRFLKRVHAGLLALPGVEDLGVRSLADLVEPPPSANLLDIHDFLATVPEGPAFADLLARIRRMPLAGALLLSPDGRAAALYVAVAKGADRGTLIAAIERFLGSPDLAAASGFELRVTGPVAAETVLGREVLRDLSRLVPLMVAAVALLLWLSLRTPGGIFIPLAQVLATLVWTLGGMGWAGMPVTLFTTVLPVLLMAMAMTDEIHLLVRVQDRLREGEEFPEPGHLRSGSQTEPPIVIPSESEGPGGRAARDLLLQEVRETAPRPGPSLTLGMTEAGFSRGNRVSRSAAAAAEAADANRRARLVGALSAAYADLTAPLALSSIATATGFLSFLFTSIGPLAQFGLATGVGMLFAMLFTFSLVPALAVVLPAGWIERRALAGDPSDRGLASAA